MLKQATNLEEYYIEAYGEHCCEGSIAVTESLVLSSLLVAVYTLLKPYRTGHQSMPSTMWELVAC